MQLNIQTSELRTLSTNGKVISTANEILKDKGIRDIVYLPTNRILSALIAQPNEELNFVSILLNSNGRPGKFQCSCTQSKKFWGFCVHATALIMHINGAELNDFEQPPAAALKLQTLVAQNKKNKTQTASTTSHSNQAEQAITARQVTKVNEQLSEITAIGSELLQRLFKANLLHELKNGSTTTHTINYELVLTLPTINTYSSQHCPRLSLNLGTKDLHPLINWWTNLQKRQQGEMIKLGKDFIWHTMLRALPEPLENFLDYLSQNLSEESIYTIEQRNNSYQDWPLTQKDFAKLVKLRLDHPELNIKIIDSKGENKKWQVNSCWPQWPLKLALTAANAKCTSPAKYVEPAYHLCTTAKTPLNIIKYGLTLIRQDDTFYYLPENLQRFQDLLLATNKILLANINENSTEPELLYFSSYQAENLTKFILQPLNAYTTITAPDDWLNSPPTQGAHPRIWLSFADNHLEVRLRIVNNDGTFFDPRPQDMPLLSQTWSFQTTEQQTIRNINFEFKWLQQLFQAGFKPIADTSSSHALIPNFSLTMPYGNNSELFLNQTIPEWQNKGVEFLLEKSMQPLKLTVLKQIQGQLSFNTENSRLDITLNHTGLQKQEWQAVLKAYRQNHSFVKLKDQSIICWGHEVNDALYTISCIEDWGGEIENDNIKLPTFRALPLLYLVDNDENWQKDETLQKLQQTLLNPDTNLDYQFNPEIQDTIRNYQRFGVNWLKSLGQYRLGGILADDMGLGKTLQTLAFISHQRAATTENLPALIIAPTALIYNWYDEINNFTPHLKAKVIRGIKEKRDQEYENMQDCDIIILSYPQIRQDIDVLKNKNFSSLFLDEAQAIKNYRTHTARAVKELKATEKFALTGTPIENNLSELWSVFDFLMPGFLYSHNEFQRRFDVANTIGHISAPTTPETENNSDDSLAETSYSNDETTATSPKNQLLSLRYLIKPFVLRRLKSEVLTELPPKVETVLTSPLLPEQQKIYQSYLTQARERLQSITAEANQPQSRLSTKHTMEILSLLTRLRQIACHPALFMPDYSGSSGKLELLEEILTTAIAGGHRILIFSQFTTLLEKIKPLLEKLAITYMYIHGQVQPLERRTLVNRFNAGEGEVFLISLKAGGTGLNLTGADTVILMDPWWNPAVEQQATDRSHRLGQQRRVQVYRLIAKDTIEEKIRQLQERKQNLIDQVVISGDNTLSHMRPEELLALFDI